MSSRREKARRIARVVSERIAEVTTPGLGRWDEAWEVVAEPSDYFMDALHLWETDAAQSSAAVELAAQRLVDAWRQADKKFLEPHRAETPEVVA